jgi:DNA-binding SARP family transcriptional activator
MMQLALSLLGPFEVTLDGAPAVFATDRARALLAYLAVEADRPHRREVLADLLWPDRPESMARQNLSQSLLRLRRAIDDYHAHPPFLNITSKVIQFHASSADLDVAHFEASIQSAGKHHHPGREQCRACMQYLEQAVGLYRGDFLQGLNLAGSLPLEEWSVIKREQLHRDVMTAFHTLAEHYEARQAYDQAQHYVERQLALEPWREGAHRQLMRVLARSGRRSAALAQYRTCHQVLADELGVEPSAETTVLYEQIKNQQYGASAPRLAEVPAPPPAGSIFPPLFVGRERELQRLHGFLAQALAGQGQIALIAGEAGAGKTALAQEFARRAQMRHPELVVAHGTCNAQSGLGDPYLPFREALSLLGGNVQGPWAAEALNGNGSFQQYETLLQSVAARRPLMLLLHGLHWADTPSLSLLFYLARRVTRSRILLVATYRPEDVAVGWTNGADSLQEVLGELKREFGDVEVDLGRATRDEGRAFIDALLDAEPNQLDEGFRQAFWRLTGGHPLFTVELLREMQQCGDLRLDEAGRWIEGPALDWHRLPARVEGVIERRLGRLAPELRQALRVASVEGEQFTAEVVARVQGMHEGSLIRMLSAQGVRQHHLLAPPSLGRLGSRLLSRYRFRHPLFQRYLYRGLDEAERLLLHREVSRALTSVCGPE